ncbi:hypothetical protein C366_00012 [Cryptococcus neoformans Tu401-1]|nr:hypothetical protein C366_00012 [Cryptococcus neoformans var. grubii Tu401-1]
MCINVCISITTLFHTILVSAAMATLTPGVSPTSYPAISSPQPPPSPVSPDPLTIISPKNRAAKHKISMSEVQPNHWRLDAYGQGFHHQKDQDQQRADELDPYCIPAEKDDEPRVCLTRISPSLSPSPSRLRSPLPSPSLKVQLRPNPILPRPSDPTAQALGTPMSSYAFAPNPLGFPFTHSDLSRLRNGAHGKCDIDVDMDVDVDDDGDDEDGDEKPMTMSEAVCRKWELMGGLAKGAGGLFRYAYDQDGNDYRPDMTHVQVIRLVIAASPRKMMTLAQIYQAIEERWPWHKAGGSTWKNSIRHNLSLNDCFINAERPTHEGGSGKGGYWTVNDKLTGKTARKLKRSLRSELENEMENDEIETDGAGGPPHPHPYPQPNGHATYFPSSFSPTHPHPPHYPHSQTHNTSDMYTTETLWPPLAQPVRSVKRYRLSQPPLSPSGSGSVSASYGPSPQLYPYSRPRQHPHPHEHELPHEHSRQHPLERTRTILANEYTRSPFPSLYTRFTEDKRDPHLRLGIPVSVPTFAQMQSYSRGALPYAPELMDRENDRDGQRDRERRVRDSVTPFDDMRALEQERERGRKRVEQHPILPVDPRQLDPSSCSASVPSAPSSALSDFTSAPTSVPAPFPESATVLISTSMANKTKSLSEWTSHHTRTARVGTGRFWKWDLFGRSGGSAGDERERERETEREQRGYYHPYPTPQTSGEIEREADYNDHDHNDHTQNHVHTPNQNQKAKYASRDIPLSFWTGAGEMGGREKAEDRGELQRTADGVELLALAAAKIQG